MSNVLLFIDGVDRTEYFKPPLRVSPGGDGVVGSATIYLDQQAGGLDLRPMMDVRVYVPFNTTTNTGIASKGRLFGGVVSKRQTSNLWTTKTWALPCWDYSIILKKHRRRAAPVNAVTLSADDLDAQITQLFAILQGAAPDVQIDTSGTALTTAMPAVVYPGGHTWEWYLQELLKVAHIIDPAVFPSYYMGTDTTFGSGDVFGNPKLWVYDGAVKPVSSAVFSDTPDPGEVSPFEFFTRDTDATAMSQVEQSIWEGLIYTATDTDSQSNYPSPYEDFSGGTGFWTDGAVVEDTQSNSADEAQALVDARILAKGAPRDSLKFGTYERLMPGEYIDLEWTLEGIPAATQYRIATATFEWEEPDVIYTTLTLNSRRLGLFDEGTEGYFAAPIEGDDVPPLPVTNLAATTRYDTEKRMSWVDLTWDQSLSPDAAKNKVYIMQAGTVTEEVILDGLYDHYSYLTEPGEAYQATVSVLDRAKPPNESEVFDPPVSGTSAVAITDKVQNDSYEELDPSDSTLPRYHTRNTTAGGTSVSSTAEHSHGIRSAKLSTAGGGTDRAGLITSYMHVRSVTGKKSAVTWDAKASHASTTMKFAIGGYDAAFAFLGAVTVSKTVGTAFGSFSTTIPATIGGSPVIYARLEPFNDNTSARDIYVDNIRVIQQSVPDIIEDDAIDGDKINPVVTLTDQTITLTSTSKILAGGGKVTVDVDGIKVGNSSGSNNIDFYNDAATRIGRMYSGGASGSGSMIIEADYNGGGSTDIELRGQDIVTIVQSAHAEQIVLDSGGLLFDSGATTRPFSFQNGSVVAGLGGVSTSATDGFLYIASSAGVPAGTPTTHSNTNALNWDRTNHNLYIYSGGSWRLISTGGTITGTGANTRLAIWTGTSTQSSDSGLTFNTTTDTLTVAGGGNFGGDMAVDASGGSSGTPRILGLTNLGYARIQVGDAFTSMQSNNGGRFVFQAYHGISFWGARGTTGSVQGFEAGGGGGDPSVRVYSSQGGTKTFAVQIASGQSANAIEVEPNGGGTALFAVQADGDIEMNGVRVLTDRITGWGAPTGTPTRTTFATGSVTLPQLAERVKALIDDLTTHGMIGA